METNATGIDLVKLFQAYEEARADNTAHFRKIMALQKRVEELEAENEKLRDAILSVSTFAPSSQYRDIIDSARQRLEKALGEVGE